MTAQQKRRRIVQLRLQGKRIVDISRELGVSQTTVRYHLWVDATDQQDRKEQGGWYGTVETRRLKSRASARLQA